MKKAAISAIVLLSLIVKAQDNIKYDKLFDDPYFLFHIKAGVFGDIDAYDTKNYRGGIYAGAIVNLGQRFAVGGDIKLGLPNWNRVQKEALNDVGGTHFDVSGRAILNFKVDESMRSYKTDLKVTSYRSGNYNITDTKYIMVDATQLHQVGLTGSAGVFRNQIVQNKRTAYEFTDSLVSATGTGISYTGLYVSGGFSIRSYVNYLINAFSTNTNETYKKKGKRDHNVMYIEGIYMPFVAVPKNVDVNGKTQDLADKPATQNFGVRIISEYHTTRSVLNGARIELGTRPGIKMPVKQGAKFSNLYFQMSLFVGINKKAKT
jgi:hypothetical protein